jgi:uncharacterized protein
MGIDFYRTVIDLQKRYGKFGARVSNGFQTNELLIDDSLAAHFSKYHSLLGISLDGPEAIHNRYRKYADGSGSHAGVTRTIETLSRHEVALNIVALVTAAKVHRAKELYTHLKDSEFNYLQFIPCVEFLENGERAPFSISGKEWGDFLCEIFDIWLEKDTRRVSVRLFHSILALKASTAYMCNTIELGDLERRARLPLAEAPTPKNIKKG